jgi:hypothetical protein
MMISKKLNLQQFREIQLSIFTAVLNFPISNQILLIYMQKIQLDFYIIEKSHNNVLNWC